MPYTAAGYRARALRNAMIGPEVILWSRLKLLRADGFHVRRQAPFRGYYLDFVCFPRRVVVEVDGASHSEPEQIAHDRQRDLVLAREGFRVIRVSNNDVRENLDHVVFFIRAALEQAEASPPGSRRRREPPSP